MCMPPFVSHYITIAIWLIGGFICMNLDNNLYLILLFITLGSLSYLTKCPKCEKNVCYINGWTTPFVLKSCDKCGQNLLKCKVDKDIIED